MNFFLTGLFFLGAVLPLRADAARLEISNDAALPEGELVSLRASAAVALFRYEATTGTRLPAPVRVRVTRECAPTGYDLKSGEVVFGEGCGVIHLGLDSPDVIAHELFHAITCQVRPEVCEQLKQQSDDEVLALMEGLADIFAYSVFKRDVFGSNFRRNVAYLRRYRSDLCFSLSEGAHARGNALTTFLLGRNYLLEDVLGFLRGSAPFTIESLLRPGDRAAWRELHLSPRLHVRINDALDDRPGRILRLRGPTRLRFETGPGLRKNYPNLRLQWRRMARRPGSRQSEAFDVFPLAGTPGAFDYLVSPRGSRGAQRLDLHIFSDDRLIGVRRFHFRKISCAEAISVAHKQ